MSPDAQARVSFRFDGREIQARVDQSVGAALLDAGVTTLTRSSKYRRPRGLHCVRGACPNCLLRVDGEPHVRACMIPVRDGMRVETEGATARRVDVFRAIDRAGGLFPVGFQYRFFKRQNVAWRLWERQLRALAADTEMPGPSSIAPGRRLAADLLVVGAGPAGLAAAAAGAQEGLRTIVVGRRSRLGGAASAALRDGTASPVLTAAAAMVRESDHVTVLAPATVVAAFGDRYVVDGGNEVIEVTAPSSVLATGAYERSIAFPGNDRPGVMLTSGLRRLVLDDRVLRDATAVLVATDDAAYPMASELIAHGVRVAAIIDDRPGAQGRNGASVEVVPGEVREVRGRRSVAGVVVEVGGHRRTIACDVVAMSGGWQAADELRYSATSTGDAVVEGARAAPPQRSAPAGSPLPTLQGAGAVVGTFDPAAALAEGAFVGRRTAEGVDHGR